MKRAGASARTSEHDRAIFVPTVPVIPTILINASICTRMDAMQPTRIAGRIILVVQPLSCYRLIGETYIRGKNTRGKRMVKKINQ